MSNNKETTMTKSEEYLDAIINELKNSVGAFETKRADLAMLDKNIAESQAKLDGLNAKIKQELARHDQILNSLSAIQKRLVAVA